MSVFVESTGPPWVITRMMSKAWKVLRIEVMRRKKVIGESIGMVTDRNRHQRFAPSTRAASYRSRGMACKPARKITTAKPMFFQTYTMMIAGIDHSGWLSQSGDETFTQP